MQKKYAQVAFPTGISCRTHPTTTPRHTRTFPSPSEIGALAATARAIQQYPSVALSSKRPTEAPSLLNHHPQAYLYGNLVALANKLHGFVLPGGLPNKLSNCFMKPSHMLQTFRNPPEPSVTPQQLCGTQKKGHLANRSIALQPSKAVRTLEPSGQISSHLLTPELC